MQNCRAIARLGEAAPSSFIRFLRASNLYLTPPAAIKNTPYGGSAIKAQYPSFPLGFPPQLRQNSAWAEISPCSNRPPRSLLRQKCGPILPFAGKSREPYSLYSISPVCCRRESVSACISLWLLLSALPNEKSASLVPCGMARLNLAHVPSASLQSILFPQIGASKSLDAADSIYSENGKCPEELVYSANGMAHGF